MTNIDCKMPGWYRCRDGRLALVAGYNPDANYGAQVIGWMDDTYTSWTPDGKAREEECPWDLIDYLGPAYGTDPIQELMEATKPEPPKAKRAVKMAPALAKFYDRLGVYVTRDLYADEEAAREDLGERFVRWLAGTPYELEVEVDE